MGLFHAISRQYSQRVQPKADIDEPLSSKSLLEGDEDGDIRLVSAQRFAYLLESQTEQGL
jgi:hypothetical protein